MQIPTWVVVVLCVLAIAVVCVGVMPPSVGETDVDVDVDVVATAATTISTTTTTTTVPTTVPTGPTLSGSDDPADPVFVPPEPIEGACTYYDDAAFLGDSVSDGLRICAQSGYIGHPLFLTRASYSVSHAVRGSMLVRYQGEEMAPEDALAQAGVRKVFIMFGTNDIAAYGLTKTMENWAKLLENIRAKCPDIQIFIQSCTPIFKQGEVGALNNQRMDEYNVLLEEFAAQNSCHFVEIGAYMKDGYGGMAECYTSDRYVHLNATGGVVWMNLLRAYAQAASEAEQAVA